MVIFRTDDNLSLAMILTLSKHHLESVGTQVWVILLICQEMVILVHKFKNDDKLECDFWGEWFMAVCDVSNSFETSFGGCLKLGLADLDEISRIGHGCA